MKEELGIGLLATTGLATTTWIVANGFANYSWPYWGIWLFWAVVVFFGVLVLDGDWF